MTASSFNVDMIIAGDLNVNCLKSGENGNYIDYICELFDLKQLIKEPTRVTVNTMSLIDVIMTSMPEKHSTSQVFKITLSDHYLVYTDLSYTMKFKPKEIKCRSFKNVEVNNFVNELSQSLENINYEQPLSSLWDTFKMIFCNISNKHAPNRVYRIKGKAQPWVTDDVVSAMKERDLIHKQAVESKNENDFNDYRIARNKVTLLLRNKKRNYFKSIANNPKINIWSSIKMLTGIE